MFSLNWKELRYVLSRWWQSMLWWTVATGLVRQCEGMSKQCTLKFRGLQKQINSFAIWIAGILKYMNLQELLNEVGVNIYYNYNNYYKELGMLLIATTTTSEITPMVWANWNSSTSLDQMEYIMSDHSLTVLSECLLCPLWMPPLFSLNVPMKWSIIGLACWI